MNPENEKLKDLIKQKKELEALIRQLKDESNNLKFGNTVKLTKNEIWHGVYRFKIRKVSTMVDSEEGRYITLIEDTRLDKLYLYLKQIYKDIEECMNKLEFIMEVRNEDND